MAVPTPPVKVTLLGKDITEVVSKVELIRSDVSNDQNSVKLELTGVKIVWTVSGITIT